MNFTPFIIILFSLNFLMLFLIAYLFFNIKVLKNKLINVSYEDVKLITETLKDLIVESEKVSEKLDMSIKEKEALLEDLVDLIDAKLKRLEQINNSDHLSLDNFDDKISITYTQQNTNQAKDFDLSGMSLREKVIFLSQNGLQPVDVAKRLGISITEVNLVLKHGR